MKKAGKIVVQIMVLLFIFILAIISIVCVPFIMLYGIYKTIFYNKFTWTTTTEFSLVPTVNESGEIIFLNIIFNDKN